MFTPKRNTNPFPPAKPNGDTNRDLIDIEIALARDMGFEKNIIVFNVIGQSWLLNIAHECDMVVVSKCPDDVKPVDLRMIKEHMDLFKYQQLYFSKVRFGAPEPVFPIGNPDLTSLNWLDEDDLILGIAGIANPRPFAKYLKQFGTRLKVIHYNDHHNYTRDDFRYIFRLFDELKGARKYIVTTEKDAVRILNSPYFPPTRQNNIYFIPIQVDFLNYEDRDFIHELQKKIEGIDDI